MLARESGASYSADPVRRLVAEAQREQAEWVIDFAARLLEASAAKLRVAPDWITEADLQSDDEFYADVERRIEARKAKRRRLDSDAASG